MPKKWPEGREDMTEAERGEAAEDYWKFQPVNTPMSLDEWIEFEEQRMRRFKAWYLTQQETNPTEQWPLTANPGDWDEQYQMFPDPQAPR